MFSSEISTLAQSQLQMASLRPDVTPVCGLVCLPLCFLSEPSENPEGCTALRCHRLHFHRLSPGSQAGYLLGNVPPDKWADTTVNVINHHLFQEGQILRTDTMSGSFFLSKSTFRARDRRNKSRDDLVICWTFLRWLKGNECLWFCISILFTSFDLLCMLLLALNADSLWKVRTVQGRTEHTLVCDRYRDNLSSLPVALWWKTTQDAIERASRFKSSSRFCAKF